MILPGDFSLVIILTKVISSLGGIPSCCKLCLSLIARAII